MKETHNRTIVISTLISIFIFIPFLVLFFGFLLDSYFNITFISIIIQLIGISFIIVGIILELYSYRTLVREGDWYPATLLPPAKLVSREPYDKIRHPMYLWYFFIVTGLSLLLNSPGALLFTVVFFPAFFMVWVKYFEEPALYRRVGYSYRLYRKKTYMILPFSLRTPLKRIILYLFKRYITFEIEGTEKIPEKGPVVFVFEGHSIMDYLLAKSIQPEIDLIPVSAEFFRYPLYRIFFRILGAVPHRSFRPDVVPARKLKDVLQNGGTIGIALDGDSSWTGELSVPSGNIVRSLRKLKAPIVPVAFSGIYRMRPRWAAGADLSKKITIRIGPPFQLKNIVTVYDGTSSAGLSEAIRYIQEQIGNLRGPDERSIQMSCFPTPRPGLVLWRCPVCYREETIKNIGNRWLRCDACSAFWESTSAGLMLTFPEERRGEKDTIAGWKKRSEVSPLIYKSDKEIFSSDNVELREDPNTYRAIASLHSHGFGRLSIYCDRLQWEQGRVKKEFLLHDITSVTIERNDMLQLCLGKSLAQFVLAFASPLRWEFYVKWLIENPPKVLDSAPPPPTGCR